MSLSVICHKEAVSNVGKCFDVGNPGSQGFFSTLPSPCVVVKKYIYIYPFTTGTLMLNYINERN